MMDPEIEKFASPLRNANGRLNARWSVHLSFDFVLDDFVGFIKSLLDIADFLIIHQYDIGFPGL
jgi:hypothetical protein